MASNTLTDLIPDMYRALDIVSREVTGFIRAVNRNSNAEAAAVNQTVRVPVTRAHTSTTITPAVTPPDTGDTTVDNVSITLTKQEAVWVRFDGEEEMGLQNAGNFDNILQSRLAQGMRELVNQIEADLAALYVNASRAAGTAGTTPFGTKEDLTDLAAVLRILEENGAPQSDLHCVLGHAAMQNIRGKQTSLFKVNEAGSDELLRSGSIGMLQNFAMHHSHQIKSHTAGTGSGFLVNDGTDLAVGDTTIAADTGTGTILSGDVVTLAGDATASKYVVGTALSGGSFAINKPGIQEAVVDNAAITVGASHVANMAFHRDALVLAMRPPATPSRGDLARDTTTITDPNSGLVFSVSDYPQYKQAGLELGVVWGTAAIKPEHIALLLG